ncbi:zinc-ribbon domain-containing protein [Neisseria sp. Ec49-e6-T10]|uniref:zinc-ribbon domain-containing protein n=1 Tax=Neisseria sp. Ec49-e6-T10 TaxID=3140744 RepID=UPI003EB86BEA
MIIWGSKNREKVKVGGHFNCPDCGSEQPYKQITVARYFTLYFIPLFPTQTLGTYIKCATCHAEYNESVLTYVPPTEDEKLRYSVYEDLASGMPVQMVIQKKQNQGFSEFDAKSAVNDVLEGNKNSCVSCQLDFLSNIENCSNCGENIVRA